MKTHLLIMKNSTPNNLLFFSALVKNLTLQFAIKTQSTLPFRKTTLAGLTLAIMFLCFNPSYGQVNISGGGSISENFDGMAATATATLPAGWKADKSTTVRAVGSYAAAVTATERIGGTSLSGTATNGIYNYGLGAAGVGTERALGGLSSGSASKSVNIFVDLLNSGAGSISSFTISYNVEKYRNGTNTAGYRIQMYYSTDGSTWTDAGANFLTSFGADLDNLGFATVPGATVSVTSQTLTQAIASGGHLYLAWNYSVTSGTTTSNAQAIGVDDVVISAAGAAPEITLSTNSLTNFGSVQVGNSSAEQTYTVSGTSLTDTLHLLAPNDFEISLTSGSGFNDTLFLLPSSGTVTSTTIYARFSPTAAGAVSDSIVHTSAGAATKKVGVAGTGSSCSSPNITPGGPTTFCVGGSVVLTADAGVSYLWSTLETTQSITVSSAGSYTVTVTDGASCSATSAPTTVTVSAFSYSGVIFSENMGNPGGNVALNPYTGWQNNGLLLFSSASSTASDVRITGASSGYAGSTGTGNVFMGTATSSTRDFIISGINTTGYSSLTLSFGLVRDNISAGLTVEVSDNGGAYTPLTITQPPTANVWALTTASGTIPASSNLSIRFSKNNGTAFRIDDVTLSGSVNSVSISALGSTTICQGTYVTLVSNIPNGNEWSPVFAFSQSIQATTQDTYTVTVTDLNGCSITSAPVSVTVIAAPTATTSFTDALCAGASSGTATAIPSGGLAPYTYSWNTVPVQTTITATGLLAGTYIVTVTDAAGCTGTASATVGEPLPLQIATSTTTPSTIGGNDGTATAVPSDGTAPYTYSWNTIPVQTTDIATGLIAGTYTVIVTDFNGCQDTAQATVVDPIPNITVSTSSLANFGSVVVGNSSAEDFYFVEGIYLTDSILLVAPAGFEISLTSGSGFTDTLSLTPAFGIVSSTIIYVRFTPLSAGAASGLITHTSTGATQEDVAVSGTGISCPQATITPSGPLTFCSPGSVTLTASAGATYLWSTSETTSSIVVSTSGSYTVQVTDAFSCTTTSDTVVVVVNDFSVTGPVFVENMGNPGGTVTLSSYTGWQNNGIFSFSSTSINPSDVRITTPSTYIGASGTGNVFMGTSGGNGKNLIISGINTMGYTGLELSFGMLRTNTAETLQVSVSTDGINYSPITTTAQPATNVWALVTDSIGTIPNTTNLYLKFEKSTGTSFRIDDISITGTTNTLTVTPNGPTTICDGTTLILTSNIYNGNDWSPEFVFSQSLFVTVSGTYSTTVTDINGCTQTSAPITVISNPSPLVDTLISTNLLCNNDSSGTISASVSGGTTPYT
nr:SprB repeat-containing protein [Bacteroidia bacterium]